MNCPHCGAEHPEKAGRFCEQCGLSVTSTKRGDSAPAPAADEPQRCPSCGTPAGPPLCPACYTRIRAPGE